MVAGPSGLGLASVDSLWHQETMHELLPWTLLGFIRVVYRNTRGHKTLYNFAVTWNIHLWQKTPQLDY